MRKYIDIITEGQTEVEEGFKGTVAGLALGAAALAGGYQHSALNTDSATTPVAGKKMTASEQLEQIQNMHFSDKAERVAKEKGFNNAAEMFLRMKQQQAGGTHQVTTMDKVKAGVEDAKSIHPASLLGHVNDRVTDALNQSRD